MHYEHFFSSSILCMCVTHCPFAIGFIRATHTSGAYVLDIDCATHSIYHGIGLMNKKKKNTRNKSEMRRMHSFLLFVSVLCVCV